MGDLILDSLEINNFRGFKHLQIERLGRVNLIVGKNNIGKTSLLEALQLYAHQGSFPSIVELLVSRDAVNSPFTSIENILAPLRYLFYSRDIIVPPRTEPIKIGAVDLQDKMLTLAIGWSITVFDEKGQHTRPLELDDELVNLTPLNPIPRLDIGTGNRTLSFPLIPDIINSPVLQSNVKEITSFFIRANGFDRSQLGELWDRIALTKSEHDVLQALRIIAPGVERLSFIATDNKMRIPVVKVVDMDERLPLRDLGDGMQRVLGIALALANAKDGMLLIDEFENGLHYSAQPDIWRFIFKTAHRLNVQVFATTHSWDCIEAFQQTAQEDQNEGAVLIRLNMKDSGIDATLFDERRLAIATREQIEVR